MKRLAGARVTIFQAFSVGMSGLALLVRVVDAVVQGGPAPQLGLRGALGELVRRGVAAVEGLQVMGGRVDEDGARLRERGQEQGIGLVPAVAHVPLVEDLEARELAVDEENAIRGPAGESSLLLAMSSQ